MYSFAKIIIILFISITYLNANEYKGHYKVTEPKHSIDFETQLADQLEKQKNNNTVKNELYDKNGNLITNKNKSLSDKEKQDRDEKLRLQKQLDDYKNELEKERQRNLLEQQERERLEKKRKRLEEERMKSINSRRDNMSFGIINKNNENTRKLDNKYDLEKNISTLPVDRTRIITNDRYVVGLLENTLDTQLGGRVVIVVEDNVFGVDGRKILLPKGTRMVCNYSPLEEVGQTRVGIECNRILRPDGASITLSNAYVADAMGSTGAVGKVDNRNKEKYGHALAMSGLSGLNSYTSFMLALSDNPSHIAMAPVLQETGKNLSDVTAKILDKTLNLPPIIKVAKGSRVTLMPQTDIYLIDPDDTTNNNEE